MNKRSFIGQEALGNGRIHGYSRVDKKERSTRTSYTCGKIIHREKCLVLSCKRVLRKPPMWLWPIPTSEASFFTMSPVCDPVFVHL